MEKKDFNTEFSEFALTDEQTWLLFSLQKYCAVNDANTASSVEKRNLKENWIKQWSGILTKTFTDKNVQSLITSKQELVTAFKSELTENNTKTWFHLIILEAITFNAYFPLSNDKDGVKKYKGLIMKNQVDCIQQIISQVDYDTQGLAERYLKIYHKSLNVAEGKAQKVVIKVLVGLLFAAVTAATAGAFAGPIAVLLVGSQFPTLSGAALVSACLAFLGGGAIVAGGAGMAGGVLVIVGGGALLGSVAGGVAIAGKETLFNNSPKLVLSFAAKVNVVLREIILNEQKDTVKAQEIIAALKEQIAQQNAELSRLKNADGENKKAISNLKKSIEYMERIVGNMKKYSSSFELGMSYDS